ncbi:MAG: peptidyl-prolyl cis-trans isomerase, partial [Proteobacteria bacterium]|nr:peptidyl-prolyl cis-trans isomerase [Pseudomonadota bacterium]
MRFVTLLLMLCVLCGLTVGNAKASWSWGKKPLVVIDGKEYTADEYKEWWEYWRDSVDQKPESVQPFVDWMLMVREGERMDLVSLPEYKHKVGVFLSARTLMLLKRDEIDSKIQLRDDDLKLVYNRDYVPSRLVGVLEFSFMDEAKKFHDQFAGQGMDHERLKLMADQQPAPPFVLQHPQWLRPINTPAPWLPLLDKAKGGSLLGPLPFGEKAAILFVAEVKSGDQEDFEKKKETIKYDLRKQREQELTEKLVQNLMVKYKVFLDHKVLENINLTDPSANNHEQVVIKSDRSIVTVGYFLDQIRKETDITHKLAADAEGQLLMKRRLANAMIANSLVSWEALSRHYEEKEPLRGAYQFYLQNRLVVELENRAPGEVQVAEAEIQDYYQSHPEEFKRPEMIKGVMVSGEEAIIRKVWSEAISGTELTKTAESNGATIAVSLAHEVPYQHFSAVAQNVISSLKNGDMSQPFFDTGLLVVIKLNER